LSEILCALPPSPYFISSKKRQKTWYLVDTRENQRGSVNVWEGGKRHDIAAAKRAKGSEKYEIIVSCILQMKRMEF
jgi:hypothetical protein